MNMYKNIQMNFSTLLEWAMALTELSYWKWWNTSALNMLQFVSS